MRILLVAQWFPPIIGGEEWHVHHLGQELIRRGHEVTVVTLLQPGLAEDEDVDGMRVRRIGGTVQRVGALFRDATRKSAAPIPDPELVAAFRRIVSEVSPDVVHAHNWLVHSYLPIKRVSRIPLVLTLHDFSLVCARKDHMRLGVTDCSGPAPAKCLRCSAHKFGTGKGLVTALGTWAMAPAVWAGVDRFIAVSESVAEGNHLIKRDLPHVVIPNFIPDPKAGVTAAPPVVAIPGLPDEEFLLYVGAISRVKGVPELLRAYSGLDGPPPLVLIGYPGEETETILRDLPAGAIYLASQPHDAVLAAWQRSRLGIVPSVCRDASPTVVLEAMAAGTPVIASRIGGIPDIIEPEVSGLLVDPGSVAGLRDALARVLADGALASRLAMAGTERVRAFTAGAVVPRIEQVYEEVVRHHRREASA